MFKTIIFRIIILILFLPSLSFASETFGDAMKLYESNNGSPKKNYILGINEENNGNIYLAKKYYKLAALEGNKSAELRLGYILSQSNNKEEINESIYWLNRSLNNGYPEAANILALMYENGLGGEKNLVKAKTLYKKSIKLGSYKAYLSLADLALRGFDNEPNVSLALAYTILASRKRVGNASLFFDKLLPFIKDIDWSEIEILINVIESEINNL